MHASYDELSAWADLCVGNPTPKSIAIYTLLKYGQVLDALQLDADPIHYFDSERFCVDHMLTSFLRKNEFIDVGIDKQKVCIDAWKGTEELCKLTNDRFRDAATSLSSETHSVLHRAARKIAALLGPVNFGSLFAGSEWSSGSTVDLSRRDSSYDNKMLSKLTVSGSALRYATAYLETDYHWFEALTGVFPSGPYCVLENLFTVVDFCKAQTVPKSFKTDRFISIEPTMNIFLQKGVGKYIRRRLRRVGVDLDDQTLNQGACARAQVDCLATVDLSSASDTVSKEIVYHLLPLEWADLLDNLRSKAVLLGDEVNPRRLEKFSSMGNGFTFELESLIFWALASSVEGVDYNIYVYGDDIVIPSSAFEALSRVFSECGFTINRAKSFATGRFYESCGKHYFDGREVTPFYQKKSWTNAEGKASLPEMVRAHNRLVRWSLRTMGKWRHARTRPFLERVCKNGPRHVIPIGSLGDDGYLRPVSYFQPLDRNHGFYCRVLVQQPKVRQANGKAGIALYLRRQKVSPFAGDDYDSVSLADVSIGDGAYRTRYRWINLSVG